MADVSALATKTWVRAADVRHPRSGPSRRGTSRRLDLAPAIPAEPDESIWLGLLKSSQGGERGGSMSNRLRTLALTSGLIATVLVLTAGGAVALRPASTTSPAASVGPRAGGEIVRQDPQVRRFLALVPNLHPARQPPATRRSGCRAYVPGTSRRIPLPTHYESSHLLVGSPPRPALSSRPGPRAHTGSPRSQCVSDHQG
jgi:hypothetical protein